MTDHESVTRRQFLLDAAVGTALVSTFADALRSQGKPALTVRSINEYIAGAQREDESTQFLLAAEVKRNVVAFLDQRFALSDSQRRALEILAEEDHRRISAAVEIALRRRRRLVFRSSSAGASDGGADSSRTVRPVTFTFVEDSSTTHSAPNGEVVLSWPCPATRAKY
jgi:hypothetical protein